MVTFEEHQRFWQPWLWALLLPGFLALLGMEWAGAYRQLIQRQPFGDRPASDTVLIGITAGTTALCLGILWLMFAAELSVQVADDALLIRFFPFLKRRIPYADIRSAQSRRYSPLGEYGGWGVRYGRNGKAYNVSGDRGVQLELTSGERLLLGSQRPDELAREIVARLPR